MALFNCYECGSEVSTTATSCPSCGARITNRASSLSDITKMVCPYCGRPWIAIRLVNLPGGQYYKCQCGGVWET